MNKDIEPGLLITTPLRPNRRTRRVVPVPEPTVPVETNDVSPTPPTVTTREQEPSMPGRDYSSGFWRTRRT